MFDRIDNCLVLATFGSKYKVKTSENIVDARLAGKLRLVGRENYNPIAIGDIVTIERNNNDWTITKISERKNTFFRKAPGRSVKKQIIAANIDMLILLFSVKKPEFNPLKLDINLASAEYSDIPVTIILNKIDLLSKQEYEIIKDKMSIYQRAGYQVLFTSAIQNVGIKDLQNVFRGKVNILSGPSGAGKSTLLNSYIPGLGLKVKETTKKGNYGSHTTTNSIMYPIGEDRYIADTPGERYFILWGIKSSDLTICFPEIRQYSNSCKYRDCTHLREPGCAVVEALNRGEISEQRYNSYKFIWNMIKKTE